MMGVQGGGILDLVDKYFKFSEKEPFHSETDARCSSVSKRGYLCAGF